MSDALPIILIVPCSWLFYRLFAYLADRTLFRPKFLRSKDRERKGVWYCAPYYYANSIKDAEDAGFRWDPYFPSRRYDSEWITQYGNRISGDRVKESAHILIREPEVKA